MSRQEFPRAVKIAVVKRATDADSKYTCSVINCERHTVAFGLCTSHYRKYRLYGSPTAGIYRPSGERKAFVAMAISYKGSDCLLWPFSHNGNGYPCYSDGKRKIYAHRVVCESVHGPQPVDRRYVAHSCGNGNLGCIAPAHLRWASAQENIDDKIKHGTQIRGEKSPANKLSESSVIKIYEMRGQLSCKKTGELFGVKAQTIHDIWSGRSWGWLTSKEVAA